MIPVKYIKKPGLAGLFYGASFIIYSGDCSEPSFRLFTSLGSFGARPLAADAGSPDSPGCSAGADGLFWLPVVPCPEVFLGLSAVAGSVSSRVAGLVCFPNFVVIIF